MSAEPEEPDDTLEAVLNLRVLEQRNLTHVDLDQDEAPAVVLTFGSSVVLIIPVAPIDDVVTFDLQAFYEGRPASDLIEHKIFR